MTSHDWKRLSEKVKRHIKFSCHVENCLKLAFFGKTNIAEQLSKAYRDSIILHNLEVGKNRHILSRIIDCIKFCGAFELTLRGHDEALQIYQVCFLVWSTLQQFLILF